MKRGFFAVLILTATVFAINKPANAVPYYLEDTFSIPGIYRLDGLAFGDSTGHLFGVNAAGVDSLYEFTPSGSLVAFHTLYFLPGVGGSRSLAYNSDTGNLFVSEIAASRIYEITTAGVEIGYFSSPGAGGGMTYNSNTQTLFTSAADAIFEMNPENGHLLNSFDAPGSFIGGLAFDGTNLLAYEGVQGRIYELNPSNGHVLQWFGVSIAIGDTGLAFGDGRIYVWNDATRKVHVYVPEPGTVILLGLGGLALRRKRRAK